MSKSFNQLCSRQPLSWPKLGSHKSSRLSTLQFSIISSRTLRKKERYLAKTALKNIKHCNIYHNASDTIRASGRVVQGITTDGTSHRKRYRMRWIVNWSKTIVYHSFLFSNGCKTSPRRASFINLFLLKIASINCKRSLLLNRFLQCVTSNIWKKEVFLVMKKSTYMDSFCRVLSNNLKSLF